MHAAVHASVAMLRGLLRYVHVSCVHIMRSNSPRLGNKPGLGWLCAQIGRRSLSRSMQTALH